MALAIQSLAPYAYASPLRFHNPAMMVEGAGHWVSQRLNRLTHSIRASSSLGAFALPPEIILMIASHLDSPSKISLSLTCRKLHRLCFHGNPPLSLAEKETLLLLLEKDVASLYFCHGCAKLHHWHRRWSRSITPWYKESMPCKGGKDNDDLVISHLRYIPYYYARLVMNRHLYGSTHGLSVKKLEERTFSLHDSDGFVEKLSQPRQRCSYTERVSALRTIIRIMPLLPNRLQSRYTMAGLKKGYIIKMVVYRQLGDCRSPLNWTWRARFDPQMEEKPRTAYSPEYQPGYVRDQWNKVDGIASRTPGAWVQVPGTVVGAA